MSSVERSRSFRLDGAAAGAETGPGRFQTKHGRVTVNIAGGGSFTGMNQVAGGSVQTGDSDVNLPAEYQDKGLTSNIKSS